MLRLDCSNLSNKNTINLFKWMLHEIETIFIICLVHVLKVETGKIENSSAISLLKEKQTYEACMMIST